MEEKVIWGIVNLSFLNLYSDLVAVPHMIFSGESESIHFTYKVYRVVKLGIEKGLSWPENSLVQNGQSSVC